MSLSEAEAQAAASVAAAFMDAPAAQIEAPPEAVSSTDEVEVETEETTSFDFSPEIPEDILREIGEAEIDEEVDRELASRPAVVDDEYSYSEDPVETEDSVRERLKLEKRNKWLEDQLAQTSRGKWEDEAKKFFPLSEHALGEIKATSRRSFLKQAKARHEAILPHVQKVLADAKQFVDVEKQAAVSEGRAAAKAAFGEPLTGPDVNSVDQAAHDAAVSSARQSVREGRGSLVDVFKELMKAGK
jgi:hypothetical protein